MPRLGGARGRRVVGGRATVPVERAERGASICATSGDAGGQDEGSARAGGRGTGEQGSEEGEGKEKDVPLRLEILRIAPRGRVGR